MRVLKFALLAVPLSVASVHASRQPSIVLILADDLGWNDVGYHGGDIPTPAIDRIAREGVDLDRFYACPVCSPTRAGLMTGRYPIRFGMQRAVCRPFLRVGVPPAEETLPEMLARAGYRYRGIAGKWHIGHAFRRFHPLNQGFTSFVGHFNGNIDYYTHHREGELDWHRDFEPNHDEGYSTDLIADEAVRFIERHSGNGPFFLYVPFNAPHTPLQVPERWLQPFASVADKNRRIYMAMVASMDAAIARILDALEKNGVDKNTLVWFASDNGGQALADNSPLRAGKGTVYEGGTRVAAAIRWPLGLDGGGRRVTGMVRYIDVWPTLKRVAGLGDTAGPGEPIDGQDAWPVISGRATEGPSEFFSYFERYNEELLALIDGDWKIVRRGPAILGPHPADAPPESLPQRQREQAAVRIELFNLSADPFEREDLSDQEPERVRRMLARLREFRALRPEGGVPPMTAPPPEGWKAPRQWHMLD